MSCMHKHSPRNNRCAWCGKPWRDCIVEIAERGDRFVDNKTAKMLRERHAHVEMLCAWAQKLGLSPMDVELVEHTSEDGLRRRWFFRRKTDDLTSSVGEAPATGMVGNPVAEGSPSEEGLHEDRRE